MSPLQSIKLGLAWRSGEGPRTPLRETAKSARPSHGRSPLAALENESMLLSLIIAWLVLSCVVVPIWLSSYRDLGK